MKAQTEAEFTLRVFDKSTSTSWNILAFYQSRKFPIGRHYVVPVNRHDVFQKKTLQRQSFLYAKNVFS